MADDLASPIFNFARFFDAMMSKYTLNPLMKRSHHRTSSIHTLFQNFYFYKSSIADFRTAWPFSLS